jgi:thiol:disulfide interchange protein
MGRIFNSVLIASLAGLLYALPLHAQVIGEVVNAEHVDAQLVPERLAAVPGETLWVALRLDHEEHWHTYWINPGDAGKPTEIAWTLPEGVTTSTLVWPTPERFDLPADLVDFGYTGEVFLLTPVTVPSDFSGSTLDLRADVQWLVCEDICIPGGATVSLSLPVAADGQAPLNTAMAYGFEQTRASLPRNDISLTSTFSINDGSVNLLVQATENIFENADAIVFIPDRHRIFDYKAEQNITTQLSSLQLSQTQHRRVEREAPERVGGLLLVTTNGVETAYQVDAEPAGVDLAAIGGLTAATSATGPGSFVNDLSLGSVFLFALLGGLILNLMPCVFPVLSLKVLHLASSSHGHIRQQRLHGLAYAAGVMLSFGLLAGVLLALQAGGAAIGWGFQLQQPWFVAALVFLFFVMGLSMSGVVEFGTGLMGVGTRLQDSEGYSGSFFTGVLASVVASPCTAPFMGAALGFAFTQSAPVALTVFLALGFGMALPFLILSFTPGLARWMPKPGAWMLGFRQFLAFPLYVTAVWLLWVLGQQSGETAMAMVMAGCVLLAFACWLWQRRHQSVGLMQLVRLAMVLVAVGAAGSVLFSPLLQSTGAGIAEQSVNENYEPYSAARLAALRAEGKPVFVNMTAAWCITCLVNERVALDSATIATALVDKGVTYLKGDWTNNDPAITAVLREYDTSGVPLYLMFPADASKPAEVLPQILTESIVLEALSRI